MPHALEPLAPDIFIIENLLSESLCQHVIEISEHFGMRSAGVGVDTIAKPIRSNDLLYLGDPDPLLESTSQLLLGAINTIQDLLFEHYGIRFPNSEACSILRYREGEFYKRHVDNLLLSSRQEEVQRGVPTRDVSIVGYLNQDFEGGETYFDRQNLKVKPQTGSVLVFPAFYTYPHQSLSVTRGIKFSFATWLLH
ncbi:MAG: 2OG-Fe(II) oxygenase [Cyanobacteria bacterium J06639_1]